MLKYYLIDVGLKISFQGVIQHNKYIKHISQHYNVHTYVKTAELRHTF